MSPSSSPTAFAARPLATTAPAGGILAVALAFGAHGQPAHPIDAAAQPAALSPPSEPGPVQKPDLVELSRLDPTIHLDIRYATANNFVGRPVYTEARAFLQRPAAEALVRAHRALRPKGYGLLIFDGYRPWSVTRLFWEVTPKDKRAYVANPQKGSQHNRGCAVDLTLYDLATFGEVPMTGAYDEMSERSFPSYPGGTRAKRAHRDVLRAALETEGFSVEPNEWWHFNYKNCPHYAILDIPFGSLSPAPESGGTGAPTPRL